MRRGQYCRSRDGGLGICCSYPVKAVTIPRAGVLFCWPVVALDSRQWQWQWHIQSTLGNGGPTSCTFHVTEKPILVIGVIGPRSPTGLVSHKLTSYMLFVWPSTGSEKRDVPSSMHAVRQPRYLIRNQAVVIAAIGMLDVEVRLKP